MPEFTDRYTDTILLEVESFSDEEDTEFEFTIFSTQDSLCFSICLTTYQVAQLIEDLQRMLNDD